MSVRETIMITAKHRKKEVIDLYNLKGKEKEIEEQLQKIWYRIGTDFEWFYDMEVQLVSTFIHLPLVVSSDTYNDFSALNNRKSDYV